ncbi:MAG: REP element-mobilizing transposase RayT [Candidatus Alkanophagales archaeon MCA70_species_1]|nr:REP element-mobilizing transposase RayT [Candidatus Alkanophaga volatiphilum]
MHIYVDAELHRKLRAIAPEVTGKIRGALEDAINEALSFWIMKREDELDIKRGAHTVWSLNYHFVFVPKYRKKILEGRVKERLRELIAEQCEKHGFEIISIEIMPDHIHLFISAPPRYAPSEIMKLIKGYTARELFKEFPELKKELWGGEFWAKSYYVASHGKVSSETIRRYIEECQGV